MTILIIGGAGYVGAELIAKLPSSFEEVVVFDNLSRKNFNFFFGVHKLINKNISFVRGDILDTRKLSKVVERSDIVVHLAAKVTAPFANQHSHGFDQVNNWGTSEVVRLVEKSKASKFIYASSTSIYGTSTEGNEQEIGSDLKPETYYSISKAEGEKHVERLLSSNITTYILRLGNIYGYSKCMRLDSVINKFMFEANFTNRLRIDGSGNQLRSFIHIDRLVNELCYLIANEVDSGKYNVVENVFSINEIVDEFRKLFPTLEMLFVNQNLQMKSLNVAPNLFLPSAFISLEEDLWLFKKKFTF